ncbi:MAG: sulfurtransferase TusA family protein [Acidobacteriota bacterium]
MNGAELVEVDARGLYCPIPILRLASALERCPPGGRALLLATDRDAIPDVDSYCRETGATLISLREENEVLIFEVAKAEALG